MKKLAILILLIVSVNLSAQTTSQKWLTDYKEAMKVSERLNNPILVFVTNNISGEGNDLLQNQFFNSEEFAKYRSSFVLLKLDTTANPYHNRLAAHYTNSNIIPALVLIDKNGNPIDKALTEINSKNISEFLSFLKTKTKY
ncbi:MAG: thioredoxin family protein [Psychroserpens sp.]|nr:thioredoxin family protein [Psychroserpens sp.]